MNEPSRLTVCQESPSASSSIPSQPGSVVVVTPISPDQACFSRGHRLSATQQSPPSPPPPTLEPPLTPGLGMREPTLAIPYPAAHPTGGRATTPTSFYDHLRGHDDRSQSSYGSSRAATAAAYSPSLLQVETAPSTSLNTSTMRGLMTTHLEPPVEDHGVPSVGPTTPSMYLCADGGGTSVKVVIYSDANGGQWARGSAGPCNVKTVGPQAAVQAILQATRQALNSLGYSPHLDHLGFGQTPATGFSSPTCAPEMYFRRLIFKKIWLGLAGIMHQPDIDIFRPYARRAFGLRNLDDDEGHVMRITNDGHLLASPCTLLPHVDSTVVLVAGTGTVGLAFRKSTIRRSDDVNRQTIGGNELQCVGINGGWGYLLGDEGSAFSVARLAIRSLLTDDDQRQSFALTNPSMAIGSLTPSSPTSPLKKILPLYQDLLNYFGVRDCSSLVDKTYSDHGGERGRSPVAVPLFTISDASDQVLGTNTTVNSLADSSSQPKETVSEEHGSTSSASSVSSCAPQTSQSSFHTAETNRKVWIAEASRIVFKYAFMEDEAQGIDSDEERELLNESRETALQIAREAVSHLVQQAVDLVGGPSASSSSFAKSRKSTNGQTASQIHGRVSQHTVDAYQIDPTTSLLSLGGGLWKVPGYVDLLVQGLKERGITFREIKIIDDAPTEGVKALIA